MTVALCATAIVVLALLWEVALPWIERRLEARRRARSARRAGERRPAYDPGRERRAEQRARELLQVVRERGGVGDVPRPRLHPRVGRPVAACDDADATCAASPYAYLVYPHKPIVAYLPQTGQLLNEYCVEFPDETRPYGSPRLPDSDDVLAKWMALKGDERRLIAEANMHLPGRQIDPQQIQRDIWRLGRWERERLERARRARATRRAPTAPASRGTTAVSPARRPSTGPDPKHDSRALAEGRAAPRARLPEGHRLRRRGAQQADHRRRQHVDRDDAVQLPPARARRQGQGGHPRRRRHADGVQHDRDLRRHHDGHERDEDARSSAAR